MPLAIAETNPLLVVYPQLFHEPSNIVGISITFLSICNPSSSRTNFFAFSSATFMFPVQSYLDNFFQYFVYSEKVYLQTEDTRPTTL